MTTNEESILVGIVDDNELMRLTLTDMLEAWGCATRAFSDSQSLRTAIEEGTRFGLLVIDERMPNERGSEMVPELRIRFPDLPIVLLSGDLSQITTIEPDDVHTRKVAKPISLASLGEIVSWASNPIP